jgi:FO synthase
VHNAGWHAPDWLVLSIDVTGYQLLNAGANDLGGTLTNESISRAAGASHGQEMVPESMHRLIKGIGRSPRQRNTLYGDVPAEQASASFAAPPPAAVQNCSARGFRQIDSRLRAS